MPSILNSDDGVVSGTSGLKTTGGNDGLLNIQTNGSTAISISSGQRSTFPTTIGVGNATPSTSGVGISFPATFSGSSDANTLDDYEEGSFTPIILGGSVAGTITYNASSTWGRYVKIGPLVNFQLAVVTTAGSGATGDALVGGLPFTVRNFTNYYPSAAVGFFLFATTGWTQYDQSSLLLTNTTRAVLYYASNTGSQATAASVWNGAASVYLSGAYLTDS